MTSNTQDLSCRLLALPAELRNRIYEYTFASTEVDIRSHNVKRRNAGLLLTCKQIHNETLLFYYSLSEFLSLGPKGLPRWLAKLTPTIVESIQRVLVYHPSRRVGADTIIDEARRLGIPEPEKKIEVRNTMGISEINRRFNGRE